MIIIDDNFTTPEYVATIHDSILSESKPIYWTINRETNVQDPERKYAISDSNTYSSFQMVSHVVDGHPLRVPILVLMQEFLNKHGIELNKVIRIKINMLPISKSNGKYHMPHVDSDGPHKVFLYYVNDSDGDTVFFNERFTGSSMTEFSEQQRVSPKMGRGVVFDGSIYHASSSPKDSPYRCIINVDFE